MRRVVLGLSCTVPLVGQAATWSPFGSGCNGSVPATCVASNDQNPQLVRLTLPNEYAHPFRNTNATALQIVAVELWTASVGGNTVATDAGIYLDASGPGATVPTQPARSAVARGIAIVGPNPAFNAATLLPPVTIPAGAVFWVASEAVRAHPPTSSTGTPAIAATMWRRPPFGGGAWATSTTVRNPALRLVCSTGPRPTPDLSSSAPILGGTMAATVRGGTPGYAGLLTFSLDGTQALGSPTPTSLQPLGAPGCWLFCDPQVTLPFPLDGNGTGQVTVAVPASATLAGTVFFQQSVTIDPAVNALGLLVTNPGQARIGT